MPVAGLQLEPRQLADTAQLSALRLAERWVQWAAFSRRHRGIAIRQRPRPVLLAIVRPSSSRDLDRVKNVTSTAPGLIARSVRETMLSRET